MITLAGWLKYVVLPACLIAGLWSIALAIKLGV